MTNQNHRIKQIESQIASLMGELESLRRASDSMWSKVYDSFIDEGNTEEISELWADRISEIFISWANSKREKLADRIVKTGEMPPYTDCLNELLVDVSPPGSQPPPMKSLSVPEAELEQPERISPNIPPPPPRRDQYQSPEMAAGTPKMQRVYVPTPFAEMEGGNV